MDIKALGKMTLEVRDQKRAVQSARREFELAQDGLRAASEALRVAEDALGSFFTQLIDPANPLPEGLTDVG